MSVELLVNVTPSETRVALVENAYHETWRIEAIPAHRIGSGLGGEKAVEIVAGARGRVIRIDRVLNAGARRLIGVEVGASF
mgnify:CR=1 FL=1